MPRIAVYEPLGDETRDRGEKLYYLICDEDGIRKMRAPYALVEEERFPMGSIARVDCFRGDQLIDNTSSGAAAGLILGGTRGAIIGGLLSSSPTKAWWIEIELTNHKTRYFRLQKDDSKTFLKWANKHGVTVAAAEPEEPAEQPTTATSGADEILKYKNLMDQGIITQEEFEAKKKQILDL